MNALNFQADVLDLSFEKPVVVDFWAPWCGPCRILGPVLEQLAEEQSDRWTLVKVNSDEAYDLAAAYQVMSIPNVKMFYQGKVVAEFAGALPRQAILKWLDEHIPDARSNDLKSILDSISNGIPGAVEALDAFVHDNPDVEEARVVLAGHIVFAEPERALMLVDKVKMGSEFYETAEDVRTLSRLMQFSGNGLPVSNALGMAAQAARSGQLESAIIQLIEAVGMDKSYENELPRKAAIAFFRTLGPQHELTRAYRRRFDMALY